MCTKGQKGQDVQVMCSLQYLLVVRISRVCLEIDSCYWQWVQMLIARHILLD